MKRIRGGKEKAQSYSLSFFLRFQLINRNAIREKVRGERESQRVGEKNNRKPFE